MKDNEILYMKEAIKEAMKAYNSGEIPVGAVIVNNGNIIARAHNMKETKMCAVKHAEIIAIERACAKLNNWRLIGCTMYVTMLPCPMCASAINQSRISNIYYGTVPDYAEKEAVEKILSDKNYGLPVKLSGSILEQDCGKLLKQFFVEKR